MNGFTVFFSTFIFQRLSQFIEQIINFQEIISNNSKNKFLKYYETNTKYIIISSIVYIIFFFVIIFPNKYK